MKKLTIFMLIIFSALFLFAGKGHGRGHGRHHGKMGGGMRFWMNEKVLEQIGVDEKVRKTIRTEAHNLKKKIMDIGFQIREENIANRDEFKKENPDRKKIENSIEKIAELKKQQTLIMSKFKVKVLFMLTPDQRRKAIDMLQKRKKRFMKNMMGG